MSYKNASDLLPPQLISELQKYAQGTLIYIPRTDARPWGSKSGIRALLSERNAQIRSLKTEGWSIDELAEHFNLSPDAIRKILYKKPVG